MPKIYAHHFDPDDRPYDDIDYEPEEADDDEEDWMHCPDCGGDLDGETGCMDSECGWTYEDDEE